MCICEFFVNEKLTMFKQNGNVIYRAKLTSTQFKPRKCPGRGHSDKHVIVLLVGKLT